MQRTHKHNKWLQILVQDGFPENLLRSENADLKFSVNNEGEDVNNKPRSRENVASHREGNAENRRQGNRGTEDWNSRGIMIVLHCGKLTFISLPVSPPIYRSKSAKFQLCITARRIIIFRRTAPGHICSLFLSFSKCGRRNNAKSAFQYTVNNNTTQYAKKKKKKRKNNVWTFTTIFAVGHPSSS